MQIVDLIYIGTQYIGITQLVLDKYITMNSFEVGLIKNSNN